MKIIKYILKIQHFFGFNKDTEYIKDVTVNIDITFYPKTVQDSILYNNKESEEIATHIKSQISELFKSNPKLEKRCRNVNQIWITFYDDPKITTGGSIIKKLNYVDGVLYYPNVDTKNFERDQKIKSLLS